MSSDLVFEDGGPGVAEVLDPNDARQYRSQTLPTGCELTLTQEGVPREWLEDLRALYSTRRHSKARIEAPRRSLPVRSRPNRAKIAGLPGFGELTARLDNVRQWPWSKFSSRPVSTSRKRSSGLFSAQQTARFRLIACQVLKRDPRPCAGWRARCLIRKST